MTKYLSNNQYSELIQLIAYENNPANDIPFKIQSKQNTINTQSVIDTLQDGYYTLNEIDDKHTQILNNNNEQICEVVKNDDGKYLLTHDNGTEHTLFENILSKPLTEIKKITEKLIIWKEQLYILSFVDPGASISVCGKGIINKFAKYLDNDIKSSITAGGFDAKSTKKFYKSSTKLQLPIQRIYFNGKTGQKYIYKEYIRVWYLPCVPDDLLILGRDNMKLANLGLFNIQQLKEMFFRHFRCNMYNISPSDENIVSYFDAIEYHNKGTPGIYIITANNEVINVSCTFARKSDILQINNGNEYINCINLYKYDGDPYHLKHDSISSIKCIQQMDNGDYINLNRKTPSVIYTIQNCNIDKIINQQKENNNLHENTMELHLSTVLDTAVFNHVKAKKSDGTICIYPKILETVFINPEIFTKDQILDGRMSIINETHVIAKSKFDTGIIRYVKPLTIHIKDMKKCKILPRYKQNKADEIITEREVGILRDAKKCDYQDQSNPDHVVVHASPIQVAHRKLTTLDKGAIVVDSRIVANYKACNDNTHDYICENTTIDDIHEELSGAVLTNQYDIKKWFYHFKVAKPSWKFVALIWKKLIMCYYAFMGLKNAPIYCHETASKIFEGLCWCLQDDMYHAIKERDYERAKILALLNMKLVFMKASYYDIRLNGKKIEIGVVNYKRINKWITGKGIQLLAKHTTPALTTEFESLQNKTDYQVFSGMVEYIKPHLCTSVSQDLYTLKELMIKPAILPNTISRNGKKLSIKSRNKSTRLVKSPEARVVFDRIIDKIKHAFLLHHPDMRIKCPHRFAIVVDTSLYQTGAIVLQQNTSKQPFQLSLNAKDRDIQLKTKYVLIALYSKQLHEAQTRYSATERELLGIKEAFRKFKRYATLKPLDLICDCEPVIKLFEHHKDSTNRKILRWRNDLGIYSFNAYHRKGKLMAITDYLSRLAIPTDNPTNSEQLTLEMCEIKLLLQALKTTVSTNSIYEIYTICTTEAKSIQPKTKYIQNYIELTNK